MCGILGSVQNQASLFSETSFSQILTSLGHRGPDNVGYRVFYDHEKVLCFGNTRLSINDVSSDSNQPFNSSDGRYTIIFNGEIYNFLELREILSHKGHTFHTRSDTEVLLHCWIEWGEQCLLKLRGMFAFVIYDSQERLVFCARDQFGQKPFYYFWNPKTFLFSSEINSLLRFDQVNVEINLQQAQNYLIGLPFQNSNETFFSQIFSLTPGSLIYIDLKNEEIKLEITQWNFFKKNFEWTDSRSELEKEISTLIYESVRMHMRGDCDITFTLSGGLDSSILAGVAHDLFPGRKFSAFSYISGEKKLDETFWIDKVCVRNGIYSHKVQPSSKTFENKINQIVALQGEPFQSTSVLAQHLVYDAIGQAGYKVAIDGQGADEIFFGYSGFPIAVLETLSLKSKNEVAKFVFEIFRRGKLSQAFLSLLYLGRKNPNFYQFFQNIYMELIMPSWAKGSKVDLTHFWSGQLVKFQEFDEMGLSPVHQQIISSIESLTLPSLVRYLDLNSMDSSVESRQPFLNVDLLNLILSAPAEHLIGRPGRTKQILRSAMLENLPNEVAARTDKIGFEAGNARIDLHKFGTPISLTEPLEIFRFINLDKAREVFSTTKILNNETWRLLNISLWVRNHF